jgi:uncharacterized membrane protein YdjX (TVP38/TMEM64 family)
MNKTKILRLIKVMISIIAVLIFICLTIYLFPIIKNLSTTEGQVQFKNMVSDSGLYGMLMLFGLQVAQIVLAVLPGEPLEFLSGMCYGTIGGTIFILVSVAITTALIFMLVRKFGEKYIYEFFKKEKIDKIKNSKLFKNPQKVEFIMMILFLIPGTPKDLLVYIGGLLPIKPLRFVLISTFARIPSVISSTIAGANIANGNFKIGVLAYVITFLLTGLFILLINKLDKEKITSDAINAIK